MNKYLGDWNCKEDLENDFKVKLDENINIIVACYSYEDYVGQAVVLFERNNKIYFVVGSHCSCYGLEDQWFDEEEINEEFINHKLYKGYWMFDNEKLNSEFIEVLKQYLKKEGL